MQIGQFQKSSHTGFLACWKQNFLPLKESAIGTHTECIDTILPVS